MDLFESVSKKGKLIVIDGIDGSGKETQTKLLLESLLKQGVVAKGITFPNYSSPACEPVKMYLSGAFGKTADDVNAYSASVLFAIDRFAFFKEKINEYSDETWLEFYNNGGVIITDRYLSSNLIHQGSKMDAKEFKEYKEWLFDLEFKKMGLPIPDAVLFLDVPPLVTQKLTKNRMNKFTKLSGKDIHESDLLYLEKCYNKCQEIIFECNWTKIDCAENENIKSIESIHETIHNTVTSIL